MSGVSRMCGVATGASIVGDDSAAQRYRQVQGAPHRAARLDLVRIILRLSGRGAANLMSASVSVFKCRLLRQIQQLRRLLLQNGLYGIALG